jgi:hypothetical protein
MDFKQWGEKLKETSNLTLTIADKVLERVREIKASITQWPEQTPAPARKPAAAAASKKKKSAPVKAAAKKKASPSKKAAPLKKKSSKQKPKTSSSRKITKGRPAKKK